MTDQNPLLRAINSGIRANDHIDSIFAQIGTESHPRGYVQSAYRNARRALVTALKEPQRDAAALDVLQGLRSTLVSETRSIFQDAQAFGVDEAGRQLSFYGVDDAGGGSSIGLSTELESAVVAVLAQWNAQEAQIRALLATGASDEQIAGDDEHAGILVAGGIAAGIAFWVTALLWSSFENQAISQQKYTFRKQAVAALDARTTDCCLRVHGQVQLFNDPFELTGTPRYADKVDWPAFHWWCRTSGVLYLPDFDDGLTERMRFSAKTLIDERARGIRRDIHPASAFLDG